MPTAQEIKEQIAALETQLARLPTKFPVKRKYHLRSERETNYGIAQECGLSKEAVSIFRDCCYEITLDIEIYESGAVSATHLNGVALTIPVRV